MNNLLEYRILGRSLPRSLGLPFLLVSFVLLMDGRLLGMIACVPKLRMFCLFVAVTRLRLGRATRQCNAKSYWVTLALRYRNILLPRKPNT